MEAVAKAELYTAQLMKAILHFGAPVNFVKTYWISNDLLLTTLVLLLNCRNFRLLTFKPYFSVVSYMHNIHIVFIYPVAHNISGCTKPNMQISIVW